MGLLETVLGYFRDKAERGHQKRNAARCADVKVAADVLRYFVARPAEQELTIDAPHGKALFTRGDVSRLQTVAKSVGERVFSHVMMGGNHYGSPAGWSGDRGEMVNHLKTWVFIAIDSIWKRIARHEPNVAFVSEDVAPQGQQLKGFGGRHAALGQHRYRKSLHAVKPHEQVTPAGWDHPLVKLFKNPNKPDVSFDFWYELGLFLELTGNSYIWAVPSHLGLLDRTYKAAELWVIPSHWVWPRIGQNRLIDYYEIRPWIGRGVLKFPPEDVIHIRHKSPIHKIDGFSHLTAGAEWIDTSESVNRARFHQFKNGCFPSGNLKLGDRYADLDDTALERMYAKLYSRFQGEANTGKPIITPPDSEYVPLVINPTEMAYTQTADQLRDMILALWRVPKEIAGIQDAGSEIAMYGPLRQFAENCLIPRLTYLGQVLTEKLAHRWDRRLRVWWDDPAGEDPEQKRANIQLLYDTQSIAPNEIRGEYGMEAWEFGGENPMANGAEVPFGTGEEIGMGMPGQPGPGGLPSPPLPAPAVPPPPQARPGMPQAPQRNGVAHAH